MTIEQFERPKRAAVVSRSYSIGRLAFVVAIATCTASCKSRPADVSTASDASSSDAGDRSIAAAAVSAERSRRAEDVTDDMRSSRDRNVRTRAVQAIARIADSASETTEASLLKGLIDEDGRAVAWAAHGIGALCKDRESRFVRALAERGATLARAKEAAIAPDASQSSLQNSGPSARTAIVRALGKCGTDSAERTLAAWLKDADWDGDEIAFALGDIASKKRLLTDDTLGVLAERALGVRGAPPLDAALYPLARLPSLPDSVAARVLTAARAAMVRKGDARLFGVRALGKLGADHSGTLGKLAVDRSYSLAERSEAARSLVTHGAAAYEEIARALSVLAEPAVLVGSADYGVIVVLLGGLSGTLPKSLAAILLHLASLPVDGDVDSPLARRTREIRCAAASVLANGAYDSAAIRDCDPAKKGPSQKARLRALLKRPIATSERRTAFASLVNSDVIAVRLAALEAIGEHAELDAFGVSLLAAALASDRSSVVATAADVIHGHPDRAFTVSARERRRALDPNAPPPTAEPERDLHASIAQAIDKALDRTWPTDHLETRAALLQAATAVRHPRAKTLAHALCEHENATLRKHAERALASLAEAVPKGGCRASQKARDAANGPSENDAAIDRVTRVKFSFDIGDVAIEFDPSLAPFAASRLVALAKAGFYKGIVAHRVVPGFVVQFGDPGGDGYGGSGTLIPCETAPIPFAPLDVGVALAGRDTGSSQLFVTLARYPHLDGEYTRVGRADGPWETIAEGDIIKDVRVDEGAP